MRRDLGTTSSAIAAAINLQAGRVFVVSITNRQKVNYWYGAQPQDWLVPEGAATPEYALVFLMSYRI